MSVNTSHIIHSQVLEVVVSDEKEVPQAQLNARAFFEEKVAPILEALLDKYDPKGRTLRLDSLELDLGSVKSLDEVSEKRLKTVIEEALQNELFNNQVISSFEDKEIGQPVRQSVEEALVHFVQYGNLPWWAGSLPELSGNPIKLVLQWATERPREAVAAFQPLLKTQEQVLRRIAFWSNTHSLEPLLTAMAPQFTPAHAAAMHQLVTQLAQQSLMEMQTAGPAVHYALLKSIVAETFNEKPVAFLPEMLKELYPHTYFSEPERPQIAQLLLLSHPTISSNETAVFWNGLKEIAAQAPSENIQRKQQEHSQSLQQQEGEDFSQDSTIRQEESKENQDDSPKKALDTSAPEEGNADSAKNQQKESGKKNEKVNKKESESSNAPSKDLTKTESESPTTTELIPGDDTQHSAQKDEKEIQANLSDSNKQKPLTTDSEGQKEAVNQGDSQPTTKNKRQGTSKDFEARKARLADLPIAERMAEWKELMEENPADFYPEADTLSIPFYGEKPAVFVESAGLVLLNPFLKAFIDQHGLLEGKTFINEAAQHRCAALLYHLATGETSDFQEEKMGFCKIMAGMELEAPLLPQKPLKKAEIEAAEQLLTAVIGHWRILGNISPDGLRGSFLQREGKMTFEGNSILMQVERKSLDILLERIPWGYSTIKLAWQEKIIHVDW